MNIINKLFNRPSAEVLREYLKPLAKLQTMYRLDKECGHTLMLGVCHEQANEIRARAKAEGIEIEKYGKRNQFGINYEKYAS